MKRNYLVFTLMFFVHFLEAQTTEWLSNAYKHYERSEDVTTIVNNFLLNDSFNANGLLLWADEDAQKQLFIINLLTTELNTTKDNTRLNELTFFLIDKGLDTKDSYVSGLVLSSISNLDTQSFTQAARSRIASVLIGDTNQKEDLIKLAGAIQLNEVQDYLYSIIQNAGKEKKSIIWAAHIALARMGDETQVRYCINRVQTLGLKDATVFILVPDLVYIHSRLVFDFLMQEIMTDECLCTSTDPDNEVAITCAYRLVELMAPYIQNFPYQVYPSGDIICDDYPQMLMEVRDWIKVNQSNYQINQRP